MGLRRVAAIVEGRPALRGNKNQERRGRSRGEQETSIEINVRGLDEALTWLDALAKRVKPAAEDALLDVAAEIADHATTNAPVKTGRLRASIGSGRTPEGAAVWALAPYAAFVEYGTRFMQGRAYMGRAIQTTIDSLFRRFWPEVFA
jgi:HK97 gp10 family phage protein